MINRISSHHQSILSAEDFGGDIGDYYNLHAFLDQPFIWTNDTRASILTHNSIVANLSSTRFGEINDTHSSVIMKSHIIYEYGHIPPYDSVVDAFKDAPDFNAERGIEYCIEAHNIEESTANFLKQFFGAFALNDPKGYLVLANTFGIALAEKIFSSYIREDETDGILSSAELCTKFIQGGYGFIPDMQFVLDRMVEKYGKKS